MDEKFSAFVHLKEKLKRLLSRLLGQGAEERSVEQESQAETEQNESVSKETEL